MAKILAPCPRCGILRWNPPSRSHRMCKSCAVTVVAQDPSKRRHKHRLSASATYTTWISMRARCLNPKCKSYPAYGGRGITICERWSTSIENFLADMGERPLGMSLDRIDNDGPYSPENCRWADRKMQSSNTQQNVRITFNGETRTVSQWADNLGLLRPTLWTRLFRYNWPIERALTTAVPK